MTLEEFQNFYKQGKKKYELMRNKKFLTWLNGTIKDGYNFIYELNDLQSLIDNIVIWYELKYPERELKREEGIRALEFQDVETISNVMDIRQFFYRLPSSQIYLMNSNYRADGEAQYPIYKDGKFIGFSSRIFMKINILKNNKKDNFMLYADKATGKLVIDDNLKKYIETDQIYLDELLKVFKEKYANELDFSSLERCIFNYNSNLELRHRILEIAALKMLYSKNTTPERGYERAKRFINEFNKELNLNLSTDEIDKISDEYDIVYVTLNPKPKVKCKKS